MKKMRVENGKKSGGNAVDSGQLQRARNCIDKRKQTEAGKRNLKKAWEKLKKPIEVYTPEGVILWFSSVSEASRSLGIDGTCLSAAAKRPGKTTKGHQARFA
jgi:hypothetical protein